MPAVMSWESTVEDELWDGIQLVTT
jgi:hypothetical protein